MADMINALSIVKQCCEEFRKSNCKGCPFTSKNMGKCGNPYAWNIPAPVKSEVKQSVRTQPSDAVSAKSRAEVLVNLLIEIRDGIKAQTNVLLDIRDTDRIVKKNTELILSEFDEGEDQSRTIDDLSASLRNDNGR